VLILLALICATCFAHAFISLRSPLTGKEVLAKHPSRVLFSGGETSQSLLDDVIKAPASSDGEDKISVEYSDDVASVQTIIESRPNNKSVVAVASLISLLAVSAAAKIGILPGPPLEVMTDAGIAMSDSSSFGPYTDAMLGQDIGAAFLTGTLALVFVKGISWLAKNGYLDPRDSRKIIHTFSAPLFMLLWPIFSPAVGARFFAGVVCLANIIRLYLAGTGQDKSLAFAVSRSGNEKEALEGPFLYVLILQAAILLFWRSSPVGIVAVSTMAAGDGLADLIGRRYGKNNKWWFSPNKSMAGTLAFWVGSTLCSLGMLAWMQFTGCLILPAIPQLAVRIAAITAVSAGLELSDVVDDNYSVPLSAAVLTALFI